jgi:SAM-dependent methyltransferase
MPGPKPQRLSADQWSLYWRSDSVTTFARQFNSNYDGEFAAFWERQFARLPSRACVVDLATGNGAIALLARGYSDRRDKEFDVLGIDYADIDPKATLAGRADLKPILERIDFRGGLRLEATGLEDGSVDLLTSQYGFEYADREPAIAEALRVLKPGGRIALILHHCESAVITLARDGLAQVQLCLQQEKIDERVVALLEVVGNARTAQERQALKGNPKAERLREQLNEALGRIVDRARHYRDPEGFIGVMLPNLMKVFGAYKDASLAQKLSYVAGVRAAFDAFRERMADLANASLAPVDFEALLTAFTTAGCVVEERGVLHYSGDLMGWTLEACKPLR